MRTKDEGLVDKGKVRRDGRSSVKGRVSALVRFASNFRRQGPKLNIIRLLYGAAVYYMTLIRSSLQNYKVSPSMRKVQRANHHHHQ